MDDSKKLSSIYANLCDLMMREMCKSVYVHTADTVCLQ